MSGGGVVLGEDGVPRCPWAETHPLNREYHDTEWGLPVEGERAIFERVSLEVFQPGLSWLTILAKRPAFREVFQGFDPETVAEMSDADVDRAMSDQRIVRNRAKIEATRTNAQATIDLRQGAGLEDLIESHRPDPISPVTVADVPTSSPESAALAKELRSHGFRFVGPTNMYALMEATGLVNSHLLGCHRRAEMA